MKYFIATWLVLVLLAPAQAWWDAGHILVSEIAWKQLRDDTKKEILELLKYHPDSQVSSLADASVWPDVVRDKAHAHHRFHRPTWHYQNNPVLGSDYSHSATSQSGDLLSQLERQCKILQDRGRTQSERAVALSWIVHLVGDLHQPLHTASYYSPEFPEGDRGGNDFEVILGQKPIPLHKLWDSAGGRFLEPLPAFRLQSYLDWTMKQYPSSEFSSELQKNSPRDWAEEALQLASQEVYQHVTPGEKISNAALQKALDVSQAQIALAGYRLGQLLERSLGSDQAWVVE